MRPIQGGIEMNELSELDLQNLRHLIGGFDTTHCKMTAYAQEAGDPAVKQFFQKSAQSAMQCKQKTMVADTLAGINGELVRYGEMIPQTENMQLKQVLKQFRNQCETSQEEIYQLARSKQYYVPAAKATAEEIQHVRSVLSQG